MIKKHRFKNLVVSSLRNSSDQAKRASSFSFCLHRSVPFHGPRPLATQANRVSPPPGPVVSARTPSLPFFPSTSAAADSASCDSRPFRGGDVSCAGSAGSAVAAFRAPGGRRRPLPQPAFQNHHGLLEGPLRTACTFPASPASLLSRRITHSGFPEGFLRMRSTRKSARDAEDATPLEVSTLPSLLTTSLSCSFVIDPGRSSRGRDRVCSATEIPLHFCRFFSTPRNPPLRHPIQLCT